MRMASRDSWTPRSYLEVKGLHRLRDAVVGGRRDAVAADALEEAHRSVARWSRVRPWAPGARVDGARVLAAHPGAARGEAQRSPTRLPVDAGFQHDAC